MADTGHAGDATPPLAAWRQTKVAERLLATKASSWGTIYGAEIEEREPRTAKCRIGNRWYVNFGLADVFGFSCDPGVVGAAESALRDWGVFYGASRIYQQPRLYRELEGRIAKAVGTETAIAFNSVELPKQLRDTKIVKDVPAEDIAREIVDWIKG